MKVKFNEFLAIVYASLFDYYLDAVGAERWGVGKDTRLVIQPKISERTKRSREVRCEVSAGKRKLLNGVVTKILKVPTVEAVFLTGSVAAWNALPEADIDVLVVTSPNTLWLTRIVVVGLLKITGQYRSTKTIADRICTNIFLDTNHLKVGERNLYTAHEVLQAECLFDRGGVEKRWIEENAWAAGFLPAAFKKRKEDLKKEPLHNSGIRRKLNWLCLPLEALAFLGQAVYMRPRMTRERIGWGTAVFHPNDLTAKVFQKWRKKLGFFGYNEDQAKALFFQPC